MGQPATGHRCQPPPTLPFAALTSLACRDYVSSCTIFEVATALPAALIPLVSLLPLPCCLSCCRSTGSLLMLLAPSLLPQVAARQAVRAAVEEALDVPLLIEFTGLICWRPGGVIGWHHDANR